MPLMRLALPATVALLIAITPGAALAHVALVSSSPAPDAELPIPPKEVALLFDGELDPDGTTFTVTGTDGAVAGEGALDLTVADRNEVRGAVDIAGPGRYTVAWTAIGADGHPESGSFAFIVAAGAASPDTAAMSPDQSVLPALGSILMLAAIAIGARAARRASS